MNNPEGFLQLLTADVIGQLKNVYQPQRYRVMYADDNGNIVDDDEEFKVNQGQEESKEGSAQNVQWEAPQFNVEQEQLATLTEGAGESEVEIKEEELED